MEHPLGGVIHAPPMPLSSQASHLSNLSFALEAEADLRLRSALAALSPLCVCMRVCLGCINCYAAVGT